EVTFNEDAQSEYVNSTVILTNIEEIQFLDDLISIRKTEPVTTTLSTSDIIENGNTVTLSLALDSAPTSSVAITLSAIGLSFSSSELTFGTSNWGTPQTITLSLENDDGFQRTETIDINVVSESSDPTFNFEINAIEQITRIDDDIATELDFISGTIWDDNNANKTQDFGEEGLTDIRVYLDVNANGTYESSETSTITDATGQYIFNDLDNDNYAVGIVPDFGWEYTYPYESGKKGLVTKKDDKKIEHDGPFYEVLSSGTGSDGFSFNFRDVLDDEYKSLTGAGQTVVVIDSGIDLDHSHFGTDVDNNGVADRIIFSKTFGSGKVNGADVDGHGTHVAGTIASSDLNYSGLAPDANIIALKIFDSPGGNVADALNWCITNAEKYSIDAINMSLGYSQDFFQTENSYYLSEFYGLDDKFDALEDLGIICVASAGNGYEYRQSDYQHYTVNGSGKDDFYEHRNEFEHSTQGISAPAAYENTISVGATEYGGGNYGSITSFSQRDDDLIDVFAPGGAITAAKNGGGTVALSGTSMASPYMTGVVLLMQEAAEKTIERKLTTDEIQKIISENSIEIYDGDDEDYSIASPSREYYNFVDPNAYIDAIISLGDPKFHYADLTSGYKEYNFGLINSDSEAFSDDSENIVIRNSNLSTFALGGDDNVYGTNESDNINGGAGDDVITGNEGDDTLTGGEGNDQIDGGKGIDTVIIDNEFSELTINYSNKFVLISNRFDTDSYTNIEQFQFSDQTLTKSQTLNAAGYSFIEDTSEDDVLTGTINVDEISSKVGGDIINTHAGNDNINIDGTTYHDGNFAHNVGSITQVATEIHINLAGKVKIETVVDGGADSDSIYLGNEGDAFFLHDSYSGFHSSLTLTKDTYTLNESTQRIINVENIYGLGGDDIIDLTSPDYSLAGQVITINGGNGEDIIWGSDATETLIGGNGNDVLFGGSGNDTLIGGSGADTFEFTVTSGNDIISDYSKSQGDILKIYRRDQYEGDKEATISAGVVTFGSVTIDLGDTSLNSLDVLNVEYAII
ncbi:S8 family serine peptidase, partial [Paracoccaceae bacterium]|nr:S8 family serine peptidase [Paracoccaceae bacterium]